MGRRIYIFPRGDVGPSAAAGDGFRTLSGVVSPVSRNAGNFLIFRDLFQKRGQNRSITDLVSVNQKVKQTVRTVIGNIDRQGFLAAALRAEIRHGPRKSCQTQETFDKPRYLSPRRTVSVR